MSASTFGRASNFMVRNLGTVLGCVAGGAFGLSLYPHFDLDKYTYLMGVQKHGKPDTIGQHLTTITDKVGVDMELEQKEWDSIRFFPTEGKDLLHKGSTRLRWGAVIGIPLPFKFTDTTQIDQGKFKVNNEPVNWFTEEGQDLLESLVLSDKAKSFAIAREIHFLKSYYVYTEALFKAGFVVLATTAGWGMDRLSRSRQTLSPVTKNLVYTGLARTFVFTLAVAVTGVFYVLGKDTYNYSLDMWTDKNAANISKDYAEGGVEFYSKTMLRNRSLRELMGPAGTKFYNINGNEVEKLRVSQPTFSARKEQCVKILEELKSKQLKDSNAPAT